MFRLVIAIFMLGAVWPVSNAMAQEPARLALLIGNSDYTQKVGPLKNALNDVALVGAALNKLGFKVTIVTDADYRTMDTAIKRYVADVRQAGKGAISFFYYSGHGVADPATMINYLVPVDVSDSSDGNLWFQSYQQNEVIDKLSKQAPAATHYVVFDACRSEFNLSSTSNAEKGFVPIQQTAGLLIAYATAPNRTASDVGEGGGPYAKALAEELVKPGVEAVTMFRNVQIRVKETTGQDPWLSFPSLPSIYLAGRPIYAAKPPPAPAASPSEAERAWAVPQNTTRAETRIALIITNGAYSGPVLSRLDSPYKDGEVLGSALAKAGFEVLPIVRDANQQAMRAALNDFARRLRRAGADAVGFFYYSGHGAALAERGENYLIPTGTQIEETSELSFNAVALTEIVRLIDEAQPRAGFVVIDACRDVPFKGLKGGGPKGFVVQSAAKGMIIGFATRPGETAEATNAYSSAMASAIATPGLDATAMFKDVQRKVANATAGRQVPWIEDGLLTEFRFTEAAASSSPASVARSP
jgi:uncharacterized caspase-like protein